MTCASTWVDKTGVESKTQAHTGKGKGKGRDCTIYTVTTALGTVLLLKLEP